ncbi:Mitochondrial basic amino acids transporter [Dirofilaria immitis]
MITVGYCSDHYDRKFEQYGYFEPVLHYLIGVIAGASGVLTGHPLDTIRIRQQIEVQNVYRCCALIIRNEGFLGFFKGMSSPLKDEKRRLYTSSYDCAQKMIKQHGFLSIFKGSWITIARDGPGYGMWFVTYDFCTQKLSKNGTAQSLTASQLLLAGSIAGIMSWICNYPLDVIKTQFQANDNIYSYRQACQNIMRTYGIKGFFAGFSATIMRAIPANASIFFAAEWSYRLLDIISEWHETRFPKKSKD